MSAYEEEREDDMGDVMRILFNEGEASIRSQQQYPWDTGGISPNLPLVPYYNPEKFFISLAKVVWVYRAHEKHKASFNIGSNKETDSISNLGLQGSKQPGNKGFVLLAHIQISMAGSFTRYPEFVERGNKDVEQHWYLCEAI